MLTKFHLKLAKGHVNLCCRCCCWSHFNTTFTQQIKFARLSLNGHSTTSPPPFPTLHTSAVAACESSATGIWLTGRAATSTLGHMSKSSIGRTLSVEMCVFICVCVYMCVCLSVSMLRVCAAKGKSFLAATEELQGTSTRDSSERLRDSGE